jgi:hypothetical protein
MKPYFNIIAIIFFLSAASAKSATVSGLHGTFSVNPYFHIPTISDVLKIDIFLIPNSNLYEYHNTNDAPVGNGIKVCWMEPSYPDSENPCWHNVRLYNISTTEVFLGEAEGLESNHHYILKIDAHSTKKTFGSNTDPNDDPWYDQTGGMLGNMNRRWREVARFELVTGDIGPRNAIIGDHSLESTDR